MTEGKETGGRDRCGRRGRPPLDAQTREGRILDALEQVISEAGLEGASMNAVARAAGMSKRTLYTLYDSRAALFAAWIRRVRASLVRPLPSEAQGLPLAERLRFLLRREEAAIQTDRQVAALRALIAEAPRNPDLARMFYRDGAGAAKRLVAEELHRAAQAAEVTIGLADIETAAAILFDMAYQSPLERLINPDADPVAPDRADLRLDLAITLFLQGAGGDPG